MREGGHQGGQPSVPQPSCRDSHGTSSHHCPGDCYLAKTPQAASGISAPTAKPWGRGQRGMWSPGCCQDNCDQLCWQQSLAGRAMSCQGAATWPSTVLCCTAIDCACASPVKGKGGAPMPPTPRALGKGRRVSLPVEDRAVQRQCDLQPPAKSLPS